MNSAPGPFLSSKRNQTRGRPHCPFAEPDGIMELSVPSYPPTGQDEDSSTDTT